MWWFYRNTGEDFQRLVGDSVTMKCHGMYSRKRSAYWSSVQLNIIKIQNVINALTIALLSQAIELVSNITGSAVK